MARYNTAPQTLEVTGEQTFTYAFTGGIISLTGTTGYTVTMVSPVFFPGSKQTFYNATDGHCTLATAAGLILGNGVPVPNGTSIDIPKNSTFTMTSDGTNYVLTSALSGPAVFEDPVEFRDLLDANGKVELNPLDENVEIKPTGTGLVDISPQSSVSIQPGATATIRPTGNLILASASGSISLGEAGKPTEFPGNLDFTANNQTINMSPTGAASAVTIDPGGDTIIGAGGTLTISSDVLGNLDNVAIGQTTPATARVTSLTGTGTAQFTANAASTSTTSGSVIVTGGVGVSGDIWAGGLEGTPIGGDSRSSAAFTTLTANGVTTITNTTAATGVNSGALQVDGGVGINGALYAGSLQNTPVGSTTRSSGAFTTLYANSTVDFTATTEATDNSGDTGVLRCEGGASIAKRVYSGGGFQGAIGNVSRSSGQFTTLDANSTVTLSPGANVTLSPTGSGTVTLSPAGGGSINNMTIGATTASTGKFTNLEATGNLDVARYIRHAGDTDTYLDFEGNEISIIVGGVQEVTINGTGTRLGDTGNGYFQPVSGNYGSIQIDGGAHGGWEGYNIGGRAVFMHDNANSMGLYDDANNEWALQYIFNSECRLYYNGAEKFNTFSSGAEVTGQLRATNQVIAYYSDERLKNFEGNIDNALDKVTALNGYYYTGNDRAKELGFEGDHRQVGVSAQEVMAVMPEVVQDAPINNKSDEEGLDYKTVQYERLVPLLIEAIKELKQEINSLKGDN
jgi:hypothetical protein